MDRVNISIPDELRRQAKEAGLNISQLARNAIAAELDRLAKIAAAKEYLAELEAELGPISPEERARAEAWADRVFGPVPEEPRRTA